VNAPPPATTPSAEKRAPDHPLVAALRCYLEKQPERAMEILKRYDKPNQEMLICLLPLLLNVAGSSLNERSPQELTAILDNLQSLAWPLRPRASLVIDKMCFCAAVQGFGRYKPLSPGHRFQAPIQNYLGEWVQLYVEVSNFSSIQQGDLFETRLAGTVTMYDRENRKVWGYSFKESDRQITLTRTMPHDFSHSYGFYVPNIPAGDYRLAIHITDVPTGRTAERSLPFRVTTIPSREL
jgi:hypothetical protein